MRRFVWAAVWMAAGGLAGAPVFAQQDAAPAKLTFEGDTAMLSVAIRPDKTADFERIIAKLHEGLRKSTVPGRRAQAAGWRVVRAPQPLADGNVAYVHLIHPVVPGADYTLMQILYDEFPDERQALYELYRGAFAKNLSLLTGSVVVDLSGGAMVARQGAGQ